MSLRGRCIICTATFTETTVSALPCGHTFHERCIGEWLKTPGRGCPNCRRKCHAKDVIRIFLDVGGLNETLNVTTQESGEEALRAKYDNLQARLNDVTAEASKAKKDLSVQNGKLETLKTLYEDLQACFNDVTAEASKAKKDLSVQNGKLETLKTLIANENEAARKAAEKLELEKSQQLESRALAAEKEKCRKMAEKLEVTNKRISELEIGVTQDLSSCMCAPGGCATKRCPCRKNNVPCNSQCHFSKSCTNKSCSDHDDRARTRIGRSSLPCAPKHPAPVPPISEALKAKKNFKSNVVITGINSNVVITGIKSNVVITLE